MNNWRGCESIEYVSNGTQADPDLIYNGYTFNYWDIETALWQMFCEDNNYSPYGCDDDSVTNEFDKYVQENAESYLEDVIYGGYFEDGSKSWHDR